MVFFAKKGEKLQLNNNLSSEGEIMLRSVVHENTRELGRRKGAPDVAFSKTDISISDENIRVPVNFLQSLTQEYAFYLALPPNTYGVVTFPDGTNRNMNGGLHEVPRGLYKLQYIDKKEREALSDQRGNITSSGQKIELKMLFRYRVIDPLALLRISNPVETLINHINTGIPRYIGSRKISEISDNPDSSKSRIHAFFQQWLNRHHQLSKAFMLTSFDIENFIGDQEYIAMNRGAAMVSKQNKISQKQEEEKQELKQQLARYRIAREGLEAELNKVVTQNKAEIEKIKAENEEEKQKILEDVKLREIKLENKREHVQRRDSKFIKIIEHISNGQQLTPQAIKLMEELISALEDEDSTISADKKSNSNSAQGNDIDSASTNDPDDKVDNLTNTLLDLLNPEK